MDDRLRFREALIARLDMTGLTAADLSRRTGVSKGTIDKLRQRRVEVTNVADAIKIARYFHQSVEDFCGYPQRSGKIDELIALAALLPADFRSAVIDHIKAIIALRIN